MDTVNGVANDISAHDMDDLAVIEPWHLSSSDVQVCRVTPQCYSFGATGSTTATIAALPHISSLLQTSNSVAVIPKDNSKAFDTVNYSSLTSRIVWIKSIIGSFITFRTGVTLPGLLIIAYWDVL